MYQLTDQQFRKWLRNFSIFIAGKRKSGSLKVKRLAINVLSINTNKGLYVLAYRNLNLDVKIIFLNRMRRLRCVRSFL